MAAPLGTSKSTVNLAANGPRVSKIRRDPPPTPKKTVVPDRDELDRRTVPVGVIAFALAIVVSIVGLATYIGGWSPRQVTVEVKSNGGL